jgi:ParB/RepB/Spo0J family partition protein
MVVNEIRIHRVVEGYHPRKDSKGLEELKEQIQKNGPDPIRVRPEDDCFVVIDGNRRLSVLKELGYETVPCIIQEIDEKNAAHQSYVLNTGDYRRNLNPIEVSLHIKEMRERFGYSVRDLVNLGYAKDDQTIYNKLHLLNLPEELQEKIADGSIKPTVGYRLAQDLSRSEDKDCLLQSFEDLCAKSDLTVDKYQGWSKNRIIREKGEGEKTNPVINIPQGEIPGVFFKDSANMS